MKLEEMPTKVTVTKEVKVSGFLIRLTTESEESMKQLVQFLGFLPIHISGQPSSTATGCFHWEPASSTAVLEIPGLEDLQCEMKAPMRMLTETLHASQESGVSGLFLLYWKTPEGKDQKVTLRILGQKDAVLERKLSGIFALPLPSSPLVQEPFPNSAPPKPSVAGTPAVSSPQHPAIVHGAVGDPIQFQPPVSSTPSGLELERPSSPGPPRTTTPGTPAVPKKPA